MDKSEILKQFQTLPGVGKSIANDLWNLGFRNLNQLKGQDPEKMYENLCSLYNSRIDRCMLYTFRCVVYFVSNDVHDERLLKWWQWKD